MNGIRACVGTRGVAIQSTAGIRRGADRAPEWLACDAVVNPLTLAGMVVPLPEDTVQCSYSRTGTEWIKLNIGRRN